MVIDQVSNSHKTRDKMVVLYILIFRVLERTWEGKGF
jgi:hypothetical protein